MSANLLEMSRLSEETFIYANQAQIWKSEPPRS